MDRLICALTAVLCLACGNSPSPRGQQDDAGLARVTSDAGPPVGGRGTCIGLWQLVQEDAIRSNCPPVSGLGRTLIVDIEAGRYRARRTDGSALEVREATALDEPCSLSLRDVWHVEQIDSSFQVDWLLTRDAARGVYEDLDAWNSCQHEFRASVTRRDLRPEDVAFDARRATDELLSYWQTPCVRSSARLPPGTDPVTAELHIDASGTIERAMVDGKDVWFPCSKYRCSCIELTNASGAPQKLTVSLPRE